MDWYMSVTHSVLMAVVSHGERELMTGSLVSSQGLRIEDLGILNRLVGNGQGPGDRAFLPMDWYTSITYLVLMACVLHEERSHGRELSKILSGTWLVSFQGLRIESGQESPFPVIGSSPVS